MNVHTTHTQDEIFCFLLVLSYSKLFVCLLCFVLFFCTMHHALVFTRGSRFINISLLLLLLLLLLLKYIFSCNHLSTCQFSVAHKAVKYVAF